MKDPKELNVENIFHTNCQSAFSKKVTILTDVIFAFTVMLLIDFLHLLLNFIKVTTSYITTKQRQVSEQEKTAKT